MCPLHLHTSTPFLTPSNFAPVRASVTQPKPLFATEGVLVETFEPGQSVARYMGRHTPYNTDIVAKVGCDGGDWGGG